jgi:hypothetical protein
VVSCVSDGTPLRSRCTESIEAATLAALIAEDHRGLATYRRLGDDAELVTLDAVPAGAGTGTALIEALVTGLRAEGCRRLCATTTNDKLSALRFYLRRGFRLIQVRPGAVDESRKLTPSIPHVGEHGIPIHDELDLCRILDLGAANEVPLSPWAYPIGLPATVASRPTYIECAFSGATPPPMQHGNGPDNFEPRRRTRKRRRRALRMRACLNAPTDQTAGWRCGALRRG